MEQFNPFNPEYKKVEDLPENWQNKFKNMDNGFVEKSVYENIEDAQFDWEYLIQAQDKDEVIKRNEQILAKDEVTHIRKIIREIYGVTKELIGQILNEIEKGEYQLLIGDDASGRIPTLIIRKFINEVYKKKGFPEITTRFIAGTTLNACNADKIPSHEIDTVEEIKEDLLRRYIAKTKKDNPSDIKNALIITEMIDSGLGIRPLATILGENKITPTVCTLCLNNFRAKNFYEKRSGGETSKEQLEELYMGRVIWGGGWGKPSIYSKSDISGVLKQITKLHATSVRSQLPIEEKRIILAKMAIARDEANNVAELLIAELLK